MPNFKEDRLSASKWAYNLLQSDFVVLDTETTGLGPDAEICEIAITNKHGRNLFSSLVKQATLHAVIAQAGIAGGNWEMAPDGSGLVRREVQTSS